MRVLQIWICKYLSQGESHITNWISLGLSVRKGNATWSLDRGAWSLQLPAWSCSIAECGTKMNPRVQKLWHMISINTSQCESLAAACKRVSPLAPIYASCKSQVAVEEVSAACCKCLPADATVSDSLMKWFLSFIYRFSTTEWNLIEMCPESWHFSKEFLFLGMFLENGLPNLGPRLPPDFKLGHINLANYIDTFAWPLPNGQRQSASIEATAIAAACNIAS